MEFAEFKSNLEDVFAQNSLLELLDDEKAEKLYNLTKIMLEVNKSMNLTAITDERSVILKHYADSLTVLSHLPPSAKVIDVGCGAGFPCLPLAIFRNDIKITALDATAKRIKYVEATANSLGLENICAISARAEELAKNSDYRESYDVATARAVANLPVLAELCLPFVKVGGSFLAMKASQGEQELKDAQNAIKLCGGTLDSVSKLVLKDLDSEDSRIIGVVLKKSPTPPKFPRHFSQISKKPL